MQSGYVIIVLSLVKYPMLTAIRYAAGLLLITPLGDLLRRRQILLALVLASASFSIGLAVTNNLMAFEALCFLVGMSSVTPQILIPLAVDLAPPERRATAVSVGYAGISLGTLVGRVISGIIGRYTSWRVVYYVAIGVQYALLAGIYLIIPDFPSKNKGMSYFGILRTMLKFSYTEPILIQGCLITFASSAIFSNFWVTLTFLLGQAPFNYDR